LCVAYAKMMSRVAPLVRRFSTRPSGLQDAVIVSVARTPIGAINSALSSVRGPELGAIAIKGALSRAGIAPSAVQEVIMGNVVSAGIGQAPARQSAIYAGIPESAVCTTINKVCASGMKSIMYAAQSVMLGHADVVVAGGFESMSNVPYYLLQARAGMRYGHGVVTDGCIKDGLWDAYNDIHMGNCAEKTSKDMGITRAMQDEFAIGSYKRAAAATAAGHFASEIVGVPIKSKKGETMVTVDEEVAKVDFAKLPTLKSAFMKDGTITAANASKLNDGAAALVIMSAAKAKAMGVKPLARIRGFGDAEQAPIDFPTAPAKAVPIALARAGLSASDMHYHEINEAFSCVVLANARLLGLDLATINVWGGAVALGHPIGCSGARIVGTLVNVLRQRDATFGTASICNGGGGGSAIVIERLA
jgi:acetyl-CoA C-acetyltransferase